MASNSNGAANEERLLTRQNAPWLLAILLVNAVVFYALLQPSFLSLKELRALFDEWQLALPVGIGAIIVGIVTAQFSPENKSRLVFWRWRHPLPGHRAFTTRDPRYTMDAVKRACGGELPVAPDAQNELWFKLYRKVAEKLTVRDAHKNFLLYRDYTAISVLLIIAFGIPGFWLIASSTTAWLYFGALVLQYLLARQAAKSYGGAFVTNVLAETVSPSP